MRPRRVLIDGVAYVAVSTPDLHRDVPADPIPWLGEQNLPDTEE